MRSTLVIVLALLGACNREPDFDERYDAASKQIGTSARRIDMELEKRDNKAGQESGSPAAVGP
jgi:hypothetical protein